MPHRRNPNLERILGIPCFLFLMALILVTANLLSATETPIKNSGQMLLEINNGWQVRFEPATYRLVCWHEATGTRVSGRLSFAVLDAGKCTAWSVEPSRDFAGQRLALVDEHQNSQGYINVYGDANQLNLTVLPRPPHLFAGELVFTPDISLGTQAFACRTRLSGRTTVVQMASGAADSRLNDSIFDPAWDVVLRLVSPEVEVRTLAGLTNQPMVFEARLAANIQTADAATITIELLPDYYRSRYVPKYHQIDRLRCPTTPTGWMSWNTYFDKAGEKENLDEARVGAKYLKPFGLEIWSIESWQENSARLPVSHFYNLTLQASSEKFPHGMKWLAEQIRALGFRPGVWSVPWGTGDEKFYLEHRKRFLHDANGNPMSNWNGRYILDPSQAEVRRQMEESYRTMSAEWGYEFFKIDGMSGRDQGLSAHFFERPEVRAAFRETVSDPYLLCLEALRKGIGSDRVFLACQGHYTGHDVEFADAARLGTDIVHPNQPPNWESYLNQARVSQDQLFVNNIIWYNDPDTLMVGTYAPLDEARLATTVVALPGQLTFFGDKLGLLPPDRMRLLQQTLPVCDVHPLDLLPNPDLKPIWDLKIRRPFASWDVVSLFNWNDQPDKLRLDFVELGLNPEKEYLVYDFWNRRFLGSIKGGMDNSVNAHANLLLAIHENLGHPQLISTDRHITQGGVEWTDETWNQERKELTCSFNLVENDPMTAIIHMPASYKVAAAKSEEAKVEKQTINNAIVSITLRRVTSGTAKLVLMFSD